MKNKFLAIQTHTLLILTLFFLTPAMNEATSPGFIPQWDCNRLECWNLDLSLYGGYINGDSKEIVYNRLNTGIPYKISQLDWKIRNLWVLGGEAKVNFLDDRLHISVNGWNKIHASKSKMVDRDFYNIEQPSVPTEISWHPDTRLKTAFQVDIMVDYDFFCFQYGCQEIKLGILAGYEFQKIHWNAYGGHYSYRNGKINGNFPAGELVIAYTQEFCVPYIGLQVSWNWKNCVDVCLFGKYTTLAYVKDHDFHALREAHFTGKFCDSKYLVIGAEATWNIYRCFNLELKYNYEHLNNTTGDATETMGGFSFKAKDSVGTEHTHHMIALGLSASF